jgi:putative endonuclease
MMKKWYLYMIETTCGKLYTGITTNIEKRFNDHSTGKGAKFFRIFKPLKVVHEELFENRSEASKREIEIKKLSRSQKIRLINDKSGE